MPTQSRVRPRQPARRDKIAESITTIPEPEPNTRSRKDSTSRNNAVPGLYKGIAIEDKQAVVTKKGDVADYADAKGSSLPKGLAPGPSGEGSVYEVVIDSRDTGAAMEPSTKKNSKKGNIHDRCPAR